VLKCDSIITKPVLWSNFLKLKNIRDRVAHVKAFEQHSLHPLNKSLWSDLLLINYLDYSKIAFDIIEYHSKSASHFKNLYWFNNHELAF